MKGSAEQFERKLEMHFPISREGDVLGSWSKGEDHVGQENSGLKVIGPTYLTLTLLGCVILSDFTSLSLSFLSLKCI